MLVQTKEFNPITSISRSKQLGHKVTMASIAGDIRHNHTNYDDNTWMLQTDDAEAFILETYRLVVNINPAVAPAMKQWAQSKMKGLA